MSKILTNDDKCFGCGLCSKICPKNAISLNYNQIGFLVPTIDNSKCVNCSICYNYCPINMNINTSFNHKVFVGYTKDDEVRFKSSSGGIFFEISKNIIEKSGIVFGAAYNKENMEIRHISAITINELKMMQGSKYVQSNILDVFSYFSDDDHSIKLFSGTPCQVAAIKQFIRYRNIDCANIFFVDILCHGCPSPIIFKDYIQYIEKKYKCSLDNHEFRCKRQGWHKHLEQNKFTNGKLDFKSYDSQLMKKMFYSGNTLRESCFHCKFASTERVSDLTIGDFRGIEKTRPELDDNKGISFMYVNSNKGYELLEMIKNSCNIWDSSFEEIKQPNFFSPTKKPKDIDDFRKDYSEKGFLYTAKKWYGLSIVNRIKEFLYKLKK